MLDVDIFLVNGDIVGMATPFTPGTGVALTTKGCSHPGKGCSYRKMFIISKLYQKAVHVLQLKHSLGHSILNLSFYQLSVPKATEV